MQISAGAIPKNVGNGIDQELIRNRFYRLYCTIPWPKMAKENRLLIHGSLNWPSPNANIRLHMSLPSYFLIWCCLVWLFWPAHIVPIRGVTNPIFAGSSSGTGTTYKGVGVGVAWIRIFAGIGSTHVIDSFLGLHISNINSGGPISVISCKVS